ncbi:hypothetical protein LCGC14_0605610 [marine sediment metagenome]|uniref:Baseplate J-like central domain-containing protein n=2 Tax=root TaxID=1 RepID=A0A9C9NJF1_9HYPH|nr:hypothetical protein [Aurantimonas coralicida]
MPFDLPTFEELRDLLIASFGGRIPEGNTNKRGDIHKRLSVVALGILDNHFHIQQVGLDVLPDTAEGDQLRRHATIYGVTPKGASGSAGDTALRVFGDVGAAMPVNEPLTHLPSGLFFKTRSGGVIPAGGFLDVDVAADPSVGELTNLEVGQELTFDVVPLNLEATSRIVVELTNGQDDERDDDLRDRLLNRIGQPAAGGNRNDWEQFALEAAAFVDSAFVYPNRNGFGAVDVAALKAGTGAARLLDAGERATVLAHIDSVRPVSAIARVLEVFEEETDVEILVDPESDPAFGFDWNDLVAPTVLLWTPATRTLQFNAARPVSMAAGHRLVIDTAGSSGAVQVIEALSGADSVILRDDLSTAPVLNDPVYAGGPLTDPVRDNVIALFDELGTANPDAIKYGPWEGNLRLSTLFERVQTTDGVLDSQILDPVANVEASDTVFPDNDTIGLLTPGKILVRTDHT